MLSTAEKGTVFNRSSGMLLGPGGDRASDHGTTDCMQAELLYSEADFVTLAKSSGQMGPEA